MSADFHRAGTVSRMDTGSGQQVVMFIHGMWSRPPVWDNFRSFFEARGYRTVTPALRHRTEPGVAPHPDLGTTSIADYAADLTAEIEKLGSPPLIVGHSMGGLLAQILAARKLARAAVCLASAHCAGYVTLDRGPMRIFSEHVLSGRFWRRPQLPSLAAMRSGVLNGLPPAEQDALYATLVPESGRAFFEIGYWFLDRQRTTWINPADVSCPLLMLTGAEDALTPLAFTRRVAEGYGDRAVFEGLPERSHWLPAEPGWERIAERAATFFEKEAPMMARRLPASRPIVTGDLVHAG
ncbi:alpha/beta hydrolase fold [Parvibaculum lavamentivorans DS-1]|uniref:Alpha/beta hydrolase fold n=1 Tax=Parvibaculum lavamentivorans (strain DS-1 / DSM 13023 / NCIMB 13966) TaxID=402881 RepID=A7HQL8_PARL1|nr:alpha/beta hydrolase [Parvibaculum lavamentivorans]ABS62201.1 alpha/beta hydrolase fold [Parvibaculum lavamentivorans DS-1]